LPLAIDVTCRSGGKLLKLKSVNICEGGMLLEDASDVKVGTDLKLDLVLQEAGAMLKLTATAVRRDLPNRVAVAFQALAPQCREAIRNYISARIDA
jgi:c-di-GMP-binding flagellar brake protein YcgR